VLVFARTGSPLLTAATYAVTFLPAVLGGPLLGGLADRLPRRRLLVAADLLRAALFAAMAVPGLPLAVLLALVLLATTVEAPWAAARAPLMREVLVDDDGYQLGTGLDEALNDSGQVLGFAAAGVLLAAISTGAALLLDAASFVLSAVAVRLLVQHHPAADPDTDWAAAGRPKRERLTRLSLALHDARLGLRAATAPVCRRPLLLTWAGISCSIAPEALAAPWGHSLGAGPVGVGLLFAAGPAGSIVGFLLVGRVSADRGRRLQLPLALLALLPLVACLAGPPLPVALLLVGLSGVGASYSLLARVTFVRGVAGPYRGRAFAIAAAGVTSGQGLGVAAAGGVAAVTSPAVAVGAGGHARSGTGRPGPARVRTRRAGPYHPGPGARRDRGRRRAQLPRHLPSQCHRTRAGSRFVGHTAGWSVVRRPACPLTVAAGHLARCTGPSAARTTGTTGCSARPAREMPGDRGVTTTPRGVSLPWK